MSGIWMVVFIGYGLLAIVLAIFFPRWLVFLPGIHWGGGGPVAGRFTAICAGLAVILAAVWTTGILSRDVRVTVAVVLGFLLLCGGMYDMASAAERTFGNGSDKDDD